MVGVQCYLCHLRKWPKLVDAQPYVLVCCGCKGSNSMVREVYSVS